MPLCGGEAVPSDGFCSVLPDTSAVLKHDAQVVLSDCMPLIRCKAVQSHSLGIVLRIAAITKIVALSNNILPKAAASLSLPSASPLASS